jgi:hypothetical protein
VVRPGHAAAVPETTESGTTEALGLVVLRRKKFNPYYLRRECTIADLAEVFTVSRTLQRAARSSNVS